MLRFRIRILPVFVFFISEIHRRHCCRSEIIKRSETRRYVTDMGGIYFTNHRNQHNSVPDNAIV